MIQTTRLAKIFQIQEIVLAQKILFQKKIGHGPGGPGAVGAGAWARAAWAWAGPWPGPGPGGARAKNTFLAEDSLDGDFCVDYAVVVTYFYPNNSPGDEIPPIQKIIFGPGRPRAARGGPGPSGRAGLGWGRSGPEWTFCSHQDPIGPR